MCLLLLLGVSTAVTVFLFLCSKINGSQDIISHSPAPAPVAHLFISLKSNPFLSKFSFGKKLQQYIIFLLFSGIVSQHALFYPEIVALEWKHR